MDALGGPGPRNCGERLPWSPQENSLVPGTGDSGLFLRRVDQQPASLKYKKSADWESSYHKRWVWLGGAQLRTHRIMLEAVHGTMNTAV